MIQKKLCDSCIEQFKPSKYESCYPVLAGSRFIFLKENITKEVAAELSALLIYYDNEDNESDINLYIHCDGGDADGLVNIYDIMQIIKSPIQTTCLGKAYSAGAVLLAAGSKGKRFAFKNSQIMIHGIQCTFPIIGYDPINSKNYWDFLNKNNDNIMKILANHTGHTLTEVKEDCKRNLFLNSKQALKYGIIDEII